MQTNFDLELSANKLAEEYDSDVFDSKNSESHPESEPESEAESDWEEY